MSSIKLKITRHVKEKNTIHNEKQINRKQLRNDTDDRINRQEQKSYNNVPFVQENKIRTC